MDKDRWTDEPLGRLHAWARQRDNCGFVPGRLDPFDVALPGP